MAGHEFAFQRFRARGLGVETFELVFNLRAGGFRGIDQRAVELQQLLFDVGQV